MFVPLSVLEFRDRAEMFFGDKVGVIDGDESFTYRAFATRTHRLANALVELGVEPGDRVSFITFNTHHLLEAYYGVIEAGAVLNPINIRLAPHEIAYILDHAASKVVFYHRDFAPLVADLAPRLATRPTFVVLEGEPGGLADHEYEALLASGSAEPRHPEIDENALAELFYTSGTTGVPEGRRDDPSRAVPAQPRRADRPRVHRGRRRAPCRAALPRERLGDAALPDHDRRAARDPAPLRSDRADDAGRAPPGDPAPRGADDLQRRAQQPRASPVRPVEPAPADHRRLAGLAQPRARARERARCPGDRRLRAHRDLADRDPRATPGRPRRRGIGRAPERTPVDDRLGDSGRAGPGRRR